MTDQQHPIRPPHELVQQWVSLACENEGYETWQDLATQAARWGADQELEACCEWAAQFNYDDYRYQDELRATRRPEPPNKKQRGLTALEATNLKEDDPLLYQEILNAIKKLPDD